MGTIQAEIAKMANEKLSLIEKLADAAGVQAELVRKSSDHPWEAIIDTAKDKACDLIVMASQARRGVSGFLLGSQTQKVLTHSSVPVLVVR